MSSDLEDFVHKKIASGAYSSREELTETAIALLRDVDQYEDFRKEVRERIAAADRGEVSDWDIDSVKAQLIGEWAER